MRRPCKMAKEIAEEYASSLADLTVNSKPLINMLTILAEENLDHAGTIVETVEKHLEKVNPDVKLPVLYLVDSIIKNVGGAYTQKFSQSIVNMFTRTFKQVDEKIRSQMFKLRETWHDVFPATKLYQLDVKVNLIDPAWPIQAQPHQANIHTATTSAVAPEDDEKMRSIVAKKEQELLMLQKKKVEMELEQVRKQLELEKVTKKVTPKPSLAVSSSMPIAMVNPVAPLVIPDAPSISVKQRLGPPVNKPSGRIAPVSAAALSAARRDPRLARHAPASAPAPASASARHKPAHGLPEVTVYNSYQPAQPTQQAPIAPNVFDIKPLERVTKRKNVITIDVRPDARPDPRRRDPRRRDRRQDAERDKEKPKRLPVDFIDKLAPKISKLPPIPKLNREKDAPSPSKRKKEPRDRRKREPVKDDSGSSPEKKVRPKKKLKEPPTEESKPDGDVVPFKELKNYHKERYMRRNREKSDTPEREAAVPAGRDADTDPTNVPEVVSESKDVDLRVLPELEPKAAAVAQKRSSTETLEGKAKKNKVDKFDILFGNEDVDLRQLPQVDEITPTVPEAASPKTETKSPKSPKSPKPMSEDEEPLSPKGSPKKDWQEVKEKTVKEVKKTPSKLDLVRAKLAEATKGKDRLGRPLLFSKSPSVEKERERRRTISCEDTDMRNESGDDFDAEDNKKTISIIMSQAKEQFNDGQLDKTQYNALMYQVFQLNEKLKLKEAKQRESLEVSKLKLKETKQRERELLEASKRKLKAHIDGENKVATPKSSPNRYGDIDDRVVPSAFNDTPPDSQGFSQDSDMRMRLDDAPSRTTLPRPPMPVFNGPNMYNPMWRGPRPRMEEFGSRRFRGPVQNFYRPNARIPRPPFERMPVLPTPQIGICQGECPLRPYRRIDPPLPLGTPGIIIPPTDFKIVEYIDRDPVKTIQIDGVPREIRFYGNTAVIMLDWDDPREIKFLPGCRRVTFDNKDSVVISFNEGYKRVEIDDQVFDIKFGAPTRELYINGRWHECFFGGNPLGVIIDGKPRLVHLEGPLPQVDIGKEKRTDLVAGKINLIVNATQMCPVYLDAKVQKFSIGNEIYTIRFVDALQTVLINEQPFKVEYGDLPKPIFFDNSKHFVRISALPRNVKPGYIQIANMEGRGIPTVPLPRVDAPATDDQMEVVENGDKTEPIARPAKTPSPEVNQENQGLDMLASVMPASMELASGSDYSVAEPLAPPAGSDPIPGLTPVADRPGPINLPGLGNINVTDLFAKLVATGIVQQPGPKENKVEKVEKKQTQEDKTAIHKVDMLKSHTLRGKQPGIVSRLYGGMQCSGCGSRFPPEQTVRYSQHLDWHFRQNRRERDSARRAHSRHWHYDLSDWLQYEEIDELDDTREKNWFENAGLEEGEAPVEAPAETPSVAAGAPVDEHCAMCGDKFDQFYNEDKEEWHLRNSVRHDDSNYHPMCFDDYKASLTKEEEKKALEESIDKEEAIEIKDVDETLEPSDTESVVEVLDDNEKPPQETLEIYEGGILDDGDEDDVIYKAEPIVEVVVEEADTDDETTELRAERDKRAEADFASVKIKQEPIDPDDEPVITAEEETVNLTPEPGLSAALSSIDGNSQLECATPAPAPGAIRINISKAPIPSFVTSVAPIIPVVTSRGSMLEDISTDDEPLPPGEETELEFTLKPTLEGVKFTRTPPLKKGLEESGLCSIM